MSMASGMARWGLAGGAALLALAATSGVSLAQHRGGYGPRDGYVVAHSRWGHGTISGPVRPTRVGWEVRMPRGTWIPCGRSCSDTLRRATIDYWESATVRSPDQGPGYFHWEFNF